MLFVRNVLIDTYMKTKYSAQWPHYARGTTVSMASISRYAKRIGLMGRKVYRFVTVRKDFVQIKSAVKKKM